MRQRADQVKSSLNSQATSSSFHAEILDLWKQIAILEAEKAEREVQEVEKVVKENETLKEIETKQALAEAKNQQSRDVPEENDSEDITDSKVFDKEDVEGIETMVYVINESLNVSDLVEDKSKNSSQVDTNKEVHNCVAKGFSSDKEKEFTKDVLVEKVYDEVQTKEKGSLSNCNDCAMMSTCKNDLKVHIEMYTCASEHSSHCCDKVFPSAPALKHHTRCKHLRKYCNVRKKTFQSICKL